jgi:hypothetical protein
VAVNVSRFSTKGAATLVLLLLVGMLRLMDLQPVKASKLKARNVADK